MLFATLIFSAVVARPFSPESMVKIATFDGSDSRTEWSWKEVNDPVMGGRSSATFIVDKSAGSGVFNGTCRIVPSLRAPGFCNAETDNFFKTAPDVSLYISDGLIINARSATNYTGFKISLAADTINPQFASYKTEFYVPPTGNFESVYIPFNKFSNDWSPYTGRCDTKDPTGKQHYCCSEKPSVCIQPKNLKDISQIGIWAEGVEGDFKLELNYIAAGSAPAYEQASVPVKKDFDSVCSGPIQKNLKYNMSGRPNPVGGPADETLADAICCDPLYKPFAEPSGTWQDVDLFDRINKTGLTTFYDSVCGIPLFTAPQNRSMEAWIADTKEHGWPSFREEELVMDNVIVNSTTGEVISKCGTHLGSYLPDNEGPRYCIDLCCIAGSPVSTNII